MVAADARGFAVSARAKFNVRLEIGPKRGDGYHAIRSVVADLVIADEVEFVPAPAFQVDCDDPGIAPETNLARKAAAALSIDLPPIRVLVRKRLPMQAGLGGGSADAAAVLRGIARAASDAGRTAVTDDELFRAAEKTGSDVAACLVPGLKVVEGRGERVRGLGFAAPPWGVLLLKPAIGIDTASAYRIVDESRPSPDASFGAGDAIDRLVASLEARDFLAACALARNDFQAPIEAAFPAVAQTRGRLEAAGAPATVLCGSGACVAGIFPTVEAARIAGGRLSAGAGEWVCATGLQA